MEIANELLGLLLTAIIFVFLLWKFIKTRNYRLWCKLGDVRNIPRLRKPSFALKVSASCV